MQIFQHEINDGLEEIIKTSASVSYAAQATPCQTTVSSIKKIKSLASYEDSDLYYVQSILVSSNWNKNDDVFDKKEVWLSRSTPEDKPTNLDHNESVIIGHIVSNWPITEDGILIDENTPVENLPEKFHILTGSVIYKSFTNNDLQTRAENLISQIENGSKYVSMECFFKGFDYGLIDKSTGDYKVLERNEETSHLTKYLRSYGGAGEHDNYKIGRVLRNITFSGKGFVDKPANPDSIIFNYPLISENSEKKNLNLSNSGVTKDQYNTIAENNTMNFEEEINNLKAKIDTLEGTPEVIKEALSVATALKQQVTDLENSIKLKDATIAELQGNLETANASKDEIAQSKENELVELKKQLEEASETIAAYKHNEEEMKKKEKKMARKAALIEQGFDVSVADSAVDKFVDLTDDMFDTVTSLWAKKMPPWMDKEAKDKKEDKKKTKSGDETDPSEEAADETVLDNAEPSSETDLGVGDTDTDSTAEATRAALVEFVCNRLGRQLSSKGE